MGGDMSERGQGTTRRLAGLPAAAALTLLLTGCGASLSSLNIFDSNKATTEAALDGAPAAAANTEYECRRFKCAPVRPF